MRWRTFHVPTICRVRVGCESLLGAVWAQATEHKAMQMPYVARSEKTRVPRLSSVMSDSPFTLHPSLFDNPQLLQLRRQRSWGDAEEVGGFGAGGGAEEGVAELHELDDPRSALGGFGERAGEVEPVEARVGGSEAEVAGLDGGVVAEDRGALHGILELADVAGPVVGAQGGAGGVAHTQLRLLQLARELLQEEIDEGIDVLATGAERRDRHGEDVDAEPEVLAETAVL